MRVVSFKVCGKPEPKGSLKAFVPMKWAAAALAAGKTPRVSLKSDNPALHHWQQLVQKEAQAASNGRLFTGPVHVGLRFYLHRPSGKWFPRPHRKPDVDKLARAVLDGLTHTLLRDDAQVVELSATKDFADELQALGVLVTVYEVAGP